MFDDLIFKELFDVFGMGIQFGLILGSVVFIFSWGSAIVLRLFRDIAK